MTYTDFAMFLVSSVGSRGVAMAFVLNSASCDWHAADLLGALSVNHPSTRIPGSASRFSAAPTARIPVAPNEGLNKCNPISANWIDVAWHDVLGC